MSCLSNQPPRHRSGHPKLVHQVLGVRRGGKALCMPERAPHSRHLHTPCTSTHPCKSLRHPLHIPHSSSHAPSVCAIRPLDMHPVPIPRALQNCSGCPKPTNALPAPQRTPCTAKHIPAPSSAPLSTPAYHSAPLPRRSLPVPGPDAELPGASPTAASIASEHRFPPGCGGGDNGGAAGERGSGEGPGWRFLVPSRGGEARGRRDAGHRRVKASPGVSEVGGEEKEADLPLRGERAGRCRAGSGGAAGPRRVGARCGCRPPPWLSRGVAAGRSAHLGFPSPGHAEQRGSEPGCKYWASFVRGLAQVCRSPAVGSRGSGRRNVCRRGCEGRLSGSAWAQEPFKYQGACVEAR